MTENFDPPDEIQEIADWQKEHYFGNPPPYGALDSLREAARKKFEREQAEEDKNGGKKRTTNSL